MPFSSARLVELVPAFLLIVSQIFRCYAIWNFRRRVIIIPTIFTVAVAGELILLKNINKSSLGWFKPWVFLQEVFLNCLNGLSFFEPIQP
jgi:hypothetical protein